MELKNKEKDGIIDIIKENKLSPKQLEEIITKSKICVLYVCSACGNAFRNLPEGIESSLFEKLIKEIYTYINDPTCDDKNSENSELFNPNLLKKFQENKSTKHFTKEHLWILMLHNFYPLFFDTLTKPSDQKIKNITDLIEKKNKIEENLINSIYGLGNSKEFKKEIDFIETKEFLRKNILFNKVKESNESDISLKDNNNFIDTIGEISREQLIKIIISCGLSPDDINDACSNAGQNLERLNRNFLESLFELVKIYEEDGTMYNLKNYEPQHMWYLASYYTIPIFYEIIMNPNDDMEFKIEIFQYIIKTRQKVEEKLINYINKPNMKPINIGRILD